MSEKKQEDPLSSRLEALEYLYEHAACGYLTINSRLGLVRINTTALTWLGYVQSDEIADCNANSLVAPADKALFVQSIEALYKHENAAPNGHPKSLHIHLSQRSGATFPSLLHLTLAARPHQDANTADDRQLDIAIFHLGQQETLLDVLTNTRAKLEDAHARVQRADSRLEVIAQTTADAIITLDAQQIVVFANPAAEAMFQLNREQIIGQPIDQLIPAQVQELHRSHVIKFGRDGTSKRNKTGHLQVEGRRADGSVFPIDASISHYQINDAIHYTAIVRDISERVATEQALENTRQQVRRYAARLRSVREDEQKRISRELHDDIGQRLAALKLDIYNCESDLKNDADEAARKLQTVGRQTSEIINSVRAIATRLRPKVLDELGLAPALEVYLADLGRRYSIAHTLQIDEDIDLPESISTEVFRLVQEATHNIIKHARASHLSVIVNLNSNGVHLAIQDNGRGIPTTEPRPDALGLIGMQERVSSLGGHLNLESPVGRGTLVECFLPYAKTQT